MATTVINKCAIVNVQEVVLWDYSSVGTVAFKSIRRTCPKHGLRRIKILHDYQCLYNSGRDSNEKVVYGRVNVYPGKFFRSGACGKV